MRLTPLRSRARRSKWCLTTPPRSLHWCCRIQKGLNPQKKSWRSKCHQGFHQPQLSSFPHWLFEETLWHLVREVVDMWKEIQSFGTFCVCSPSPSSCPFPHRASNQIGLYHTHSVCLSPKVFHWELWCRAQTLIAPRKEDEEWSLGKVSLGRKFLCSPIQKAIPKRGLARSEEAGLLSDAWEKEDTGRSHSTLGQWMLGSMLNLSWYYLGCLETGYT